jgi:putative ABC transport system permease protein
MIPASYSIRSLRTRWTSSTMTVIGIALVVLILFILGGFIDGLRITVRNTASPGNWVILSKGAAYEPQSTISQQQYETLRAMPQFRNDNDGEPLISPETILPLNVAPGSSNSMNVYLRAIDPIAYKVHQHLRLAAGHWPEAMKGEWAVGVRLAAKYPQLRIGSTFHFGRRNWVIVGIFSDDGSARESEVLCDFGDLLADFHGKFDGIGNALHVVVKTGEDGSLVNALSADSRLPLYAVSERDFYEDQTRVANQLERYAALIAGMLAIGAILGGLNTMHTAFIRRRREIGVFRSLGFSRYMILLSFELEGSILGLGGAALGELLGVATMLLLGLNTRLMAVGSFIFPFHLGVFAVVVGLVGGLFLGVLGGAIPAWRASSIGICEALRAP